MGLIEFPSENYPIEGAGFEPNDKIQETPESERRHLIISGGANSLLRQQCSKLREGSALRLNLPYRPINCPNDRFNLSQEDRGRS